MKTDKKEVVRYTVEREFLAKVSVTELVSRIIKKHMEINAAQEGSPA